LIETSPESGTQQCPAEQPAVNPNTPGQQQHSGTQATAAPTGNNNRLIHPRKTATSLVDK
jgi:hypothetical protein